MTRFPFALLVTTALVVPTLSTAQTVETACADLQAMLVADLPEEMGDRDELTTIANDNDGAICLVEVERIAALTVTDTETTDVTVADTAQTTLRLEDEVTIAGRVLLQQNAPQVNVTEGATDVEIEPGTPDVTVAEQQGEILVRQAPANITIDMPAPTIRIEQAAPQIIITMPDPSVTVGATQPQVRVIQADPMITVTQAPPAWNSSCRASRKARKAASTSPTPAAANRTAPATPPRR